MQSRNNIILPKEAMKFPYPYLCTERKIGKPLTAESISVELTADNSTMITFHVKLVFSNRVIKNFLSDNRNNPDGRPTASIVCKWICTRTNESGYVFSQKTDFFLNVPKSRINAQVRIETVIVANRQIPKYRNKFLGDYAEYREEGININKYEYLAIFPSVRQNFDLGRFDATKLQSIYSLVRNDVDTEGGISLEFNNDKIWIKVNSALYDAVRSTAGDKFINAGLVPQFILMATREALERVRDDAYYGKMWQRALDECIRKNGLSLDVDNPDYLSLAQKILDKPLELAVSSILQTIKTNGSDE